VIKFNTKEKVFIFLLCLFWIKFYLFGNGILPDGLTLSTSAGFCINHIYENVFEKNEKESELEWKSYVPSLLCALDYSYSWFDAHFLLNSAIPVALGTITDKDFFLDGMGSVAKFSKHNVITDKDYLFQVDFWGLKEIGRLIFCVGTRGFYSNIKLETDDGYLQYPDEQKTWNGSEAVEYLNGTAITYEQSRFILGFGLQLGYCFSEKNNFGCQVKTFYYAFGWIQAIDNHFLRLTQFCDSMKGSGFSLEMSFSINLVEKLCILCSIEYLNINADGYTSVNSIGIITQNTNQIGNSVLVSTKYSVSIFTVGLSCKL
jgi:hypothetical protein